MLPHPHSDEFPAALRAAREASGMSRAELARKAGIHAVMPRRYEERDCGEFARPSESTYLALNRALGLMPEAQGGAMPSGEPAPLTLKEASIEQIVGELHRRGVQVSLTFPCRTENQVP
ncbi:helix-turn-helix domain-containing protein [Crenobacter intestini]